MQCVFCIPLTKKSTDLTLGVERVFSIPIKGLGHVIYNWDVIM